MEKFYKQCLSIDVEDVNQSLFELYMMVVDTIDFFVAVNFLVSRRWKHNMSSRPNDKQLCRTIQMKSSKIAMKSTVWEQIKANQCFEMPRGVKMTGCNQSIALVFKVE